MERSDFAEGKKAEKPWDYDATMREMKCTDCGSINISAEHDLGWDIDEDSEQHQNEDSCNNCGATRFWCYVYPHGGKPHVWIGKWMRNEQSNKLKEMRNE